MTPTLLGRIQVRLLLTLLVGVPLSALWALIAAPDSFSTPFIILAALLIVGLILDPIYVWLQGFRWDHDWPFAFQFIVSFLEFFIVMGLLRLGLLEFASRDLQPRDLSEFGDFLFFLSHFLTVFIPSFLLLFNGLPIFLIRWRFKGGELGRL